MGNVVGYTKAKIDALLAFLAPLASPIFTGDPKAPTPTAGDNDTSIATTAFVAGALSVSLGAYAPLASPALTGNPTAPTPAVGDNDTSIATTAFTQAAIAALVNASPSTLDTLKELADAMGDDPNFAATMATNLGLKAPIASPTFTGTPAAPTVGVGDSSTRLANTAFVQGEKNIQINAQVGTAYTAVLADNQKVVEITNAAAIAVTIPLNSSVPYPNGATIRFTQMGAGKITLSPAAGVTINSPGALLGTRAQYSTITLRKRTGDLWVLSDDVG